MEILTKDAQLALSYVDAVSRNGHRLTVEQFEAYMRSPTPVVKSTGGIGGLDVDALFRMMSHLPRHTVESTVKWLTRLQWLEVEEDHVTITGLGRAVLGAAEEGSDLKDLPVELVLDRDDKFAYARLLGTFAQVGEAALVDRFLRLDEFVEVAQRTSVARILVRPDPATVASLAIATKALALGRPLEVRTSDEIHDRFLIPTRGPVRMVGTSLSGVAKRLAISVPLGEAISEAVRARFEDAWGRATPIKPPDRTEGDSE